MVNVVAMILILVVLALLVSTILVNVTFYRAYGRGNYGNPVTSVVLPATMRKHGVAAVPDKARIVLAFLSIPSTLFSNVRAFWVGRHMAAVGAKFDFSVMLARQNERPTLLYDGVTNLVICLLAWPFVQRHGWQHVVAGFLLGLVAIGVLARHAGYILSPSLPSMLRKASWNPYLHFVGICAFDFAIVTIVVAALEPVRQTRSLLARFWQSGEDIVSLYFPRQIPTNWSITWQVFAGSVASVLVYSTIVQSITKRADFERSADDLRAMAAGQNAQGNFPRALELVNQAGLKDGRFSNFPRATALACEGQFGAAWECAMLAVPPGTSKDVVATTLSIAVALTPVSFERRWELLAFEAKQAISDLACLQVVNVLARFASVQPSPDDLVLLRQWVGSYNDRTSYSLARAQAMVVCEEPAKVRELANAAITGSAGEELFRILLLGASEFLDERTEWADDVTRLLIWRETYGDQLLPLVDQIDSQDELAVVCEQALALQSVARVASYPHLSELTLLVDRIGARFTDRASFARAKAGRRAFDRILGWDQQG